MDHNQVAETQGVERYLLREMTEDEQNQFEEHYFSCVECAADIRAATRLQDAAREYFFAAVHERPARRSWWSFPVLAPSLASLALLGVVIYQTPRQEFEGAQSVEMVALRSATRGPGDITRIPASGRYFVVYFDLPPVAAAASTYECTVTNSSGKSVSVSKIAPNNGEPASLLFKRSDFPSGQYTVAVRDSSNSVILQLAFLVE